MNMRKGYFRFAWVLSLWVGILLFLYYGWFLDKNEVNIDLPENWKQMSFEEKLDNLEGILSRDGAFLLISKIKHFKIRRQLKRMIVNKEDEWLQAGSHYGFSFRFNLGWEELGLLGLVGFSSVWMIVGLTRGIVFVIPYAYAALRHFPPVPSNEKVGSLPFSIMGEPTGSDSVGEISIVLPHEERPKRPRKPQAVWIE